MRMSNFVHLTGNIAGPVELKKTESGVAIARIAVAEDVFKFNQATKEFEKVRTNWIGVTALGSLAQRAEQSLRLGDRVTVIGSIKSSDYIRDGLGRRGPEVVADSIEKAILLPRVEMPKASGDFDASEGPDFGEGVGL